MESGRARKRKATDSVPVKSDQAATKISPRAGKRTKVKVEDSPEIAAASPASKRQKTVQKTTQTTTPVKSEAISENGLPNGETPSKGSGKKQLTSPKKSKATVKVEEHVQEGGEAADGPKVKRKRKTKEEKEAEMLPLATRTVGSKISIGAHVSGAGGVHNAVMNSVHIGGNAFALFLKSQRKWANPPLQDEHCSAFIKNCASQGYDAGKYIVPHGSYLVNLAHPDAERTKQAYEGFHDDLLRCHKLGIKLYNFHPGNSSGAKNREEALAHLAGQLNKAHVDPATGGVITLLETMATRGNTIGGTFEDLRDIIAHVTNKKRVGVCLDTCHVFAAGYDIRTAAALSATLDLFESIIGLEYLKALHVNDSKAPLGSNRDLHANIGTGFLGLRAFHALVNEPRLWGLPMVLETPIDMKDKDGKEVQDKNVWAQEIKLLERMVGMDGDSEDFVKMEELLRAKGRAERERIGDQVKRKEEKAAKISPVKKKKGKKLKQDEDDSPLDSENSS